MTHNCIQFIIQFEQFKNVNIVKFVYYAKTRLV